MPQISKTFFFTKPVKIHTILFSMFNLGELNNWTIILWVLTAAVVQTMAFLESLSALFQHCGRYILCLPSG